MTVVKVLNRVSRNNLFNILNYLLFNIGKNDTNIFLNY